MKCIYAIISPKEKLYVGSTTNFARRMSEHKSKSKTRRCKLYSSVRKWGWEAHKVWVVEEVQDETKLCEREQYWYNALKPELNMVTDIISGGLGRGKAHPFYGKNGKDHPKSRLILQLDKEDNILQEFYGAREAARQLGLNHGNISSCLSGNRKTCGGFRWSYK